LYIFEFGALRRQGVWFRVSPNCAGPPDHNPLHLECGVSVRRVWLVIIGHMGFEFVSDADAFAGIKTHGFGRGGNVGILDYYG
jgi:hypothetical protein